MNHEALTQASHSAAFLVGELQRALGGASPVAALLLTPMIADAVALQYRIGALIDTTREAA